MICAATGPSSCLPFGVAGSAIHDLDFSHSLDRFYDGRAHGLSVQNRTDLPDTLWGFIQPGKPIQSVLVESFNGKFWDACLNEHWFVDLADARRTIEAWRIHYNTGRPHSSLGFLTPEQFRAAGEIGCGKVGPSGTLENSLSFPLFPSRSGPQKARAFRAVYLVPQLSPPSKTLGTPSFL